MQCCCLQEEADFYYECFSEHMVKKSRKEHACCECNRTIKIGESYLRSTGVHGGKWHIFRTCLGCSRLIEDHSCGGRVFQTLHDDIWECYGVSIIDGSTADDDE